MQPEQSSGPPCRGEWFCYRLPDGSVHFFTDVPPNTEWVVHVGDAAGLLSFRRLTPIGWGWSYTIEDDRRVILPGRSHDWEATAQALLAGLHARARG